MTLDFYQHIPSQIDPIAFPLGSFAVRWYSISYILGFCIIYLLLLWRIGKGEIKNIAQISNFKFLISKQIPKSKSEILKKQVHNILLDLLLVSAGGALIGGRLGYVLFYNFSYYLDHPLAIISPYGANGELAGIFGMSFFGGALGAGSAAFFYARRKKLDFLAWVDFIVPAIGAGYFFGRIGNFLNGELYGRVTDAPWGMYFPLDRSGALRHPSQLYEALGEGLLVFAALWPVRNRKMAKGMMCCLYLGLYATARFGAEFFREPDTFDKLKFGWLSTGQALSIGLFCLAAGIYVARRKRTAR